MNHYSCTCPWCCPEKWALNRANAEQPDRAQQMDQLAAFIATHTKENRTPDPVDLPPFI